MIDFVECSLKAVNPSFAWGQACSATGTKNFGKDKSNKSRIAFRKWNSLPLNEGVFTEENPFWVVLFEMLYEN